MENSKKSQIREMVFTLGKNSRQYSSLGAKIIHSKIEAFWLVIQRWLNWGWVISLFAWEFEIEQTLFDWLSTSTKINPNSKIKMELLNLNTIILHSIGQLANIQKSENMIDNEILKSRQWLKEPNDHSNGH